MIFSFWYFALFLLMILGIYYVVPAKWWHGWLLLTSYVFCLTYGGRSLFILLCSTLVSYLFGIILDKIKCAYPKSKRSLICLWCGIAFCVIPLLFGKINPTSLFAGIGISFYLLQQIGYLVDIYRGKIRAEKKLIRYALFVAFFPKLVSGPIERSDNLLKQIDEMAPPSFDYEEVKSGLMLMLWGYFQKIMIADSLSFLVTNVYDHWEGYAGGTLCLASIVFAFQLYADFAGYTNIAMGAAQALGFHLHKNFEQPYLSVSIKEFWRRWHISFSSWLRDYVYIPLGGSRKGTLRYYVNLMITFTVSGLWHGTGLNYVAWGMLHGIFQVIESICSKLQKKARESSVFSKTIKRIWVFILADFALIFFRASGLKTALNIIYKMLFHFEAGGMIRDIGLSLHLGIPQIVIGTLSIILLLAVDVLHEKGVSFRKVINGKPVVVRWICYMCIVLLLTLVGMRRWGTEASGFIYMQF